MFNYQDFFQQNYNQPPDPSPPVNSVIPEGQTDINTILNQVLSLSQVQEIDENQKQTLNNHRLKPALFSVLCEIKERTVLNLRQSQFPNHEDEAEMSVDISGSTGNLIKCMVRRFFSD